MKCRLVTPNRLLFEGDVNSVIIPASKGSMGILIGHAPIMTTIGKGLMKIEADNLTKEFTIEGGIAEVRDNIISVLTNKVEEIS